MNKAFNKVIKSHAKLAILTVFAVILLSIGTTYSLFQIDKINTKNQSIQIGSFDVQTLNVENMLLTDLYPISSSKVDENYKKFTFTIVNSKDYDVDYKITMDDVTLQFLNEPGNSEYSEYKKLDEKYYKYINYKIDGKETHNLEYAKNGSHFVVLEGNLPKGKQEDHFIQFFIDNKDTTIEGAPNDINGSILSLDISLNSLAVENVIDKIIAQASEEKPDYSNLVVESGIYTEEDNDGISYYYRGNVRDNYLRFGKNVDGLDMYFRIIRVNGDGTLRIMYDGIKAHENEEAVIDRLAIENILKEDAVTQLEAWYENTFNGTEYERYIVEKEFCENNGEGVLTFKCENSGKKKVGMLSLGEAKIIGGVNNESYLNKGLNYWKYGEDGSEEEGIVPVINLSYEFGTLIKGTGTISDPYRIED